MSGIFIVLDGPDGAGTTFHSRLLAERLEKENHSVLLTAEPSDGPIARRIRSFLKGESDEFIYPTDLQKLFIDDRRDHVETVIQPALARGSFVVCDRYTLSTLAYGLASGSDISELRSLNAGFPKPDCTILLLPPLDVCLQRIAKRSSTDMFETRILQEKVHAAYRQLAQDDRAISIIDSSGEKETVAEEIWLAVKERLL